MSGKILCATAVVLALSGCATVRVPVALRSEDDLQPAQGMTRLYMLPDSAAPAQGAAAWGHLAGDSLVLYRPLDDVGGRQNYRRETRRLGKSGLSIGGYTLTDGRHVRFDGYVRRAGDQLEFQRRLAGRSMQKVETPDRFTLLASDLRSLDVWIPDVGQTMVMVGVIALVGAVGFALAVASSLRESTM